MYPYVKIFNTFVQSWTIFFVMGFVSMLAVSLLARPPDFPVSRAKIVLCAAVYISAGILGGTLLHVVVNFGKYEGLLHQHRIGNVGIASLGILFFGLLSLWILSKEANFPFIDIADFSAPYIMLVHAWVRIGCLLAGCCYGIATTLPWGFQFLSDGITRHPTQAYAMASAIAVFASSRFIYRHLRRIKGLSFFYVIFMYSFLRFFNEFLRAEGPCIAGQFKVSHPFLILFMSIGVFGMRRAIKKAADLKQEARIKKVFSGALLRLFIWFFCSVIFPLAIIYISNRIWQ